MRRQTVVVLVFIIAAAVVVGLSQFLRSQPPLELTVAVSPLLERWARDSVTSLNATDPVVNSTRRIRFNVTIIDDMAVWPDERRAPWTPENHPAAWIPASSTSVEYAREARFPVQASVPSVARTVLMWGGYASRVNVLTDNGAQSFNWDAVQNAAEVESWAQLGGQPSWQFVKLAFDRPDQAASGLAVLFSGAADFAGMSDLTGAETGAGDFRQWFEPVVRSVANFTTLGGDPARAMASRGASVAELGLLPESRWLTNLSGLLRNDDVVFAYPTYVTVFDFPIAIWSDATVTSDEQQAATILGNWLLADTQQITLVDHGLRPANGAVDETADLFAAAVPYGARLELDPAATQVIDPPSRTDAQRLLQWFNGVR